MEKITLCNSSLQASRLAYGCWRITGFPDGAEISPEREARARTALIAAYEAGFTFFDHADIYAAGEAERLFGRLLGTISGMRDGIVIATKCGIRRQGDPGPDSPYRYDSSSEHIIASCEESLRRLGVETIDLYQIHRPDYLGHPEEIARAFSELRQSGKVREFGVSNFQPSQVAALQKACPMRLIAHQVEISLDRMDRLADGTLDQCLSDGMTPFAWSPLAAGRLASNEPIDLREADHARRARVRETLDRIARAHDSTRAMIAIAFLLKHPSGIVPIIGSTDPERIRELPKAAAVDLTRDEWYQLFEASLDRRLP